MRQFESRTSAIDVPLHIVRLALWSKRLEAVALSDPRALSIGALLVLLVVPMVGIDQVLELANLVFQVDRLNLRRWSGVCLCVL